MSPAGQYRICEEGWVSRRQADTNTAMSMGPRCAVTRAGDILCTFMGQSALGINDFAPLQVRSRDGGRTWVEEGLIWPRLRDRWSIFGSLSRTPGGELLFFGSRTVVDEPGGPNWCDATQGLKQNELCWTLSRDDGVVWGEPTPIPMPIPGAAEVTGPICVARDGTWHACYSPYNTFDPDLVVDRSQLVHLYSMDHGRTWRHNVLMLFAQPYATAAEAWVIELTDGRLLSTCWNLNQQDGSDFPNAFALSSDGGRTWTPSRSTGCHGQSTSLAPLPDARALFLFNQRKHGPVGVWMAVASPAADGFGTEFSERVWAAPEPASPRAPGHSQWMQFAFGEPAAAVLPDGMILLVFWCAQGDAHGIRYVRLGRTPPAHGGRPA